MPFGPDGAWYPEGGAPVVEGGQLQPGYGVMAELPPGGGVLSGQPVINAPAPAPVQEPAPLPAVPATTPPGGVAVQPQDALSKVAGTAPGVGVHIPAPDVAGIKKASADIAQAQQDVGQAQALSSDAEAEARRHMAEVDAHNLEKHAAMAAERDANMRRIRDEQAAAYDRISKEVLPDFWGGSVGRQALGAISMALGEAGRGLTAFATGVNIGNTAKDIIDRSIASYTQQRRETIDNLFKLASAKNMLGEQEKVIWADKLKDLQWEMAAMHQSAAEHILEVAAASRGRINQAAANVLAKEQAQTANKLVQDAQQTSARLTMEKQRLGLEAYSAETQRINALTQKENQLTIREENITRQLGNDLERKLQKDASGQTAKNMKAVMELNEVMEALDSGNPIRYGAALDKYTTSATGLGARPSSVKLFEERLGNKWEDIKAHIGKAVSGQPMTEAQLQRFKEAAAGDLASVKNELSSARKRVKGGLDQDKLYSTRPDMVSRVLDSTFGPEEPAKLITIKDTVTGETKQVTEDEARKLGAIK